MVLVEKVMMIFVNWL